MTPTDLTSTVTIVPCGNAATCPGDTETDPRLPDLCPRCRSRVAAKTVESRAVWMLWSRAQEDVRVEREGVAMAERALEKARGKLEIAQAAAAAIEEIPFGCES